MAMVSNREKQRRLRGGVWGVLLILGVFFLSVTFAYAYYVQPNRSRDYGEGLRFDSAMFEEAIEQPIPFSHRLHVTDKTIDCYYCHPYTERSLNAGLPSVTKCLGCHDHIIPEHREIQKLRSYREREENLAWVRVYYLPDHVFFPHYRHRKKGVECEECHGEVGQVDRLHQVTFYMGLCIECHRERGASVECVGCHQ